MSETESGRAVNLDENVDELFIHLKMVKGFNETCSHNSVKSLLKI